jgi:hypothetical protein
MRVKVKIKDVVAQTDRATQFLLKYETILWFPNTVFKFNKNKHFIECEKWFCRKHNIEFLDLIYMPTPIEPKFNQVAIKDLIYEN